MAFSPKERFLAHPDTVKFHVELCRNRTFLNCLDSALLSYQQRLTSDGTVDVVKSSANFQKIAGAQEFVAEFKALSARANAPARKDPDNLTKV